MKRFPINIWVAVFLVIALIVVISINVRPASITTRDFSSFVLAVKNAGVRAVTVLPQGSVIEIIVEPKSGEKFRVATTALDPWGSPSYLRENGVTKVTVQSASSLNWLALLTALIPLLILGAFLFFMLRGMRGSSGGDGAMGFAKSKAKVVSESAPKTSFREVAGCDEAKEELAEVVDFLKNPARYHDIGARIPKGVLLVGPPGSGKTLLAKAVAGEARVPFFSISGSDFVEMFVGVGAARVRSLFEDARKAAPCIIFIDEIDAVGRKRGSGMGGGNDEREQTLNQLLVEMDGFETKSDIIILAATNRPDVLDAALLRPGRFDRQVVVDAPDVKGREEILRVHSRKKPLEENVDLKIVARRTPGFVGADLENLLNEAALLAARAGRRKIGLKDLDEAADRVTMGAARKSRVIPDADKLITAYHEVGHALGMLLLPHADRPHKLTIVPRGRAAGYAMPMPSESEHYSKNRLLDRIAVALAGRAAEELQFGDVTTGAQNDFQQATNIARRMVAEWGMSDTLGHVALIEEQRGYLGNGMESRNYSEDTAKAIDSEVKEIIEVQYNRALELLKDHRSGMERIVRVLLERETLTGEEFQIILEGGELPEEEPVTKRPIKDKLEPGFIPPTVLPKAGRA